MRYECRQIILENVWVSCNVRNLFTIKMIAVERLVFFGGAFTKEIELYWGFQEWIEVAKWTQKDQRAFQAEGITVSLHVKHSLHAFYSTSEKFLVSLF